jgi:NIPSNAP
MKLPAAGARAPGEHGLELKFKAWTACCIALVSFAAGALMTANRASADGDRVFELRIYHAVPGKLPALVSRFRDTTSRLLARHHLNVVGYWVADDEGAPAAAALSNTFIWVVAHDSREAAKKNWAAFGADPAFQEVVKAEQADKLNEKVDSTFMRPADFSPLK